MVLYYWLIPNFNVKDGIGIEVGSEDRVSRVERVSSVGETDGSSLVAASRRWCFVRIFLVLVVCLCGGFVPSAV